MAARSRFTKHRLEIMEIIARLLAVGHSGGAVSTGVIYEEAEAFARRAGWDGAVFGNDVTTLRDYFIAHPYSPTTTVAEARKSNTNK